MPPFAPLDPTNVFAVHRPPSSSPAAANLNNVIDLEMDIVPMPGPSGANGTADRRAKKKRRHGAAAAAPLPTTTAASPLVIDDDSDIEVVTKPKPKGPVLNSKQKLAAEVTQLKAKLEKAKADFAQELAGAALGSQDQNSNDQTSPEATQQQLATARRAIIVLKESHATELEALKRNVANAPTVAEVTQLRKERDDALCKLKKANDATTKLNSVRESLECSICMETFSGPQARWDRQPKQLPCGHVFCCLPPGSSCPLRCAYVFQGNPQSEVWPNRPLQQILETVRLD